MSEINKRRRVILGWILAIIPCAVILYSGFQKLSGSETMVRNLNEINLGEYVQVIGAIEILCVIIYLIPKTSNIGFLLLCSYVGGIIVAEWGMGYPPGLGISVAILLYVGTLIRKPELTGFKPFGPDSDG